MKQSKITRIAGDYFMRKDLINFGKRMPVDVYGLTVRANKRH